MTITSILVFHIHCIYAGDFNCHYTDWDNDINTNGECLAAWASYNDLTVVRDFMGYPLFHLGRWKSEANPDLSLVRTETTCQLPYRRVLEKFPRSQHQPSLTTTSHQIISTNKPVKR